jgi:hypothetical protein
LPCLVSEGALVMPRALARLLRSRRSQPPARSWLRWACPRHRSASLRFFRLPSRSSRPFFHTARATCSGGPASTAERAGASCGSGRTLRLFAVRILAALCCGLGNCSRRNWSVFLCSEVGTALRNRCSAERSFDGGCNGWRTWRWRTPRGAVWVDVCLVASWLTCRDAARHKCVPHRTVRSCCGETREAPPHLPCFLLPPCKMHL